MADTGGKKGKKKKGKTLNLNEFLSEGGKAPVIVPAPKNWGDEMEDSGGMDWGGDSYMSQKGAFDVTKLPTAPKASLDSSYDPSNLPSGPPYTAYVGSLPYEVTEDEIADFFHGLKLVSIRLPGGIRQKGFGYAEFEDLDSLKKALALDNETIQNRPIKVDIAGHSGHGGYRDSGNSMDGFTGGEPDRTNHDWRRSNDGGGDDFSRQDRYPPRNDQSGGFGSGDRGFGGGDRGFGGGDRGFGGGDRGFGGGDRGFGGSDRGFGRDDRGFGGGDRGFGREDRGFGGGDRGFGRDDRGFGGGDRGFGRDDRGFGGGDRGFGSGDRGFGRSDRGFGRDDRGFGREDRGFGRDDRGFGRDDRGFGRDDRGFGRDDRGFGRSDRGFGREDRGFGRDDRQSGEQDTNPRSDPRSNGHDEDSGQSRVDSQDRAPAEADNWRAGRAIENRDARGNPDGGDMPPTGREHGDQESGPRERKRLQLKPRSVPSDGSKGSASSSIFGGARPVDTSTKEKEIEERLARQRIDQDPRPKTLVKERHNSQSSADGDDRHHGKDGRKPRTSSRSDGSEDDKAKTVQDTAVTPKEGQVKQKRSKGTVPAVKHEDPKAPVFSKESMYSVLATDDNSDNEKAEDDQE